VVDESQKSALGRSVQDDDSTEIKGWFGIEGHKLYLHCLGSGSPTAIFEAGFNDTGETWAVVQAEVAKFTQACAYDRAGLGRSDPGLESPTSLQVVYLLHKLLADAGLRGPYVLVGHSLGGQYIRVYADLYPEEVAGLVLVDSSHPDQFWRSAEVLPPESPDESESTRFYREWFTTAQRDSTVKPRLYEPGSMGDVPLVVLTALHKERAEDLAEGLSEKLDLIWVELQEEMGMMSTNSTHIMLEESGHFIQHDAPEVIIESILGIIDDYRD
jgi:pimeloyl-ACP methyl ester carboxylesterase